MTEEVQKHSVHTLVFRSLKRTHDMFVSDHAKTISLDEESHKMKMDVKLKTEYSPVLHMPVLKEGRDRVSQLSGGQDIYQSYAHPGDEAEYLITGTHAYPSGPGVALTADTKMHRNPSEGGVLSMALALPPSQVRYTFASGSADNIKQWMFPDGSFIQNLSGHNAIINTLAVNSDGVLVLLLALFCTQSLGQISNLMLSVKEGLPAKTIVGDLGAVLSTPSTGFFISESRDSYVFRDLEIDADTGIISTVVVLDRESRDKYEFVAATLTGEMIRVRIEVEDVNDHSPVFPSKEVELEISELSPPGSRFQLEGATDQDEGEFSTQGYSIKESEMGELFHLDFRMGSEKLHSLDLVLNSKVDREAHDFFTLTIEAFDGGIPARTGTVQVNIRILDENDNPPVFNQSEYHTTVREDAPIGSIVSQVLASDSDLGDNSRITYEINRRQSDPNHIFSINETTGFIYLSKPLDFETHPFHELIVTARDDGAQPEYSSTFVGVKVLNINDNSPTISVLFLSETGEADVSEAAAVGDYVARISVSDPDLEEHRITVSLEGGDGKFTLKQTDDFLYALCVNSELDREERDLYELRVQASDFGTPPLSSEMLLLLKVSDANDCHPVFEQDVYTVSIAEDVPLGSSLIQIPAQDDDEGINSEIRYSILKSQQDGLFSIDPNSGLVTTAAVLDRETQMEVWFLVLAEDGGEPSLSSTATVTVLVEDVNDNEPVFQQQLYNVSIPEHLDIGSCFLQVVATDADSPEFGALFYSLSDGFVSQEKHLLFQIHPHTGELCVSQDIDRDIGPTVHDILIKAEDPVSGLYAMIMR
ncbi:hypothetical protein GOODEAATRI_003924 [Goodea atripinnis]|uniref:Cadherin domain-containing protein n=1 Tax=Goodea atripinnis TaxID=208336 RepID=A0ABV0N7N6_9TELE